VKPPFSVSVLRIIDGSPWKGKGENREGSVDDETGSILCTDAKELISMQNGSDDDIDDAGSESCKPELLVSLVNPSTAQ
jgi:hypothetical protein